jgi:hypothetical protein
MATVRTSGGRKVNAALAWDYYDGVWDKMTASEREEAIMWLHKFKTSGMVRHSDAVMMPMFLLYKKYVDSGAIYAQGCGNCYAETYRFIDNLITITATRHERF